MAGASASSPTCYPAFDGESGFVVHHVGPVHVTAEASGIHEVFVYTPHHDGGFDQLGDDEAIEVMHALRRRLAAHAAAPEIRYSQVIINHGREAGASISHPHAQILGLPFVPGEILDEERAFARFAGGCVICTTVEAELAADERVVFANDDVVCIAPFWSGAPFELLLMPRRHEPHLQDADVLSLEAMGPAIRDAVGHLNAAIGDIAYNIGFHTAPHEHAGQYHWHVHLWPNLVTSAGFERGTGVMINVTPPELAAETLRGVRAPRGVTRVSVSAEYDVSPEQLWTAIEPIESHVEWMADAEVIRFVTGQTRGVGTRFECVTAVGPIRLTDRMEVTEWDPGRAMGVRHDGLVTGTGRFTITAARRRAAQPVGLGRGADVPVVARRPARRADRWAARDGSDLGRQPPAPQETARTSAVTAAPSTITTTRGARRHAAIAAAPTPRARASSTRSLPVENVFWTMSAQISAAGTRARQRSTTGGSWRDPSTTSPVALQA